VVGSEEERAVSPVIGVILMVAITVILAAVIAAFVLDIGPGDTDPTASVSVSGEDTDSVEIELISLDSGNTDGVAIVAEDTIEDDDENVDYNEEEIIATLSTSGEVATIDEDSFDENDEGPHDLTVRAYSGTVDEGEGEGSIGDQADSQAIIEELTYDNEES